MNGLDSRLVWIYIGIGVIANVITGLLLMPLLRALWARLNKPTPLSLGDRVRLAEQLQQQQKSMERLNHMAAHPKDLYLYLFQVAFVVFLCVSAAECLLFWNLKQALPGILAAILILLVLSLILSIFAISEAHNLSAKNIEQTKVKLQNTIDEAKSKLNLP